MSGAALPEAVLRFSKGAVLRFSKGAVLRFSKGSRRPVGWPVDVASRALENVGVADFHN